MKPEYKGNNPYAGLHREFILQYQSLDFSQGGKMNLCSLDVLKALWKDMHTGRKDFPLISLVQQYFRDCHIYYMYQLKAAGRQPEHLTGLGFRPATVLKYWYNRELAERIVGFELPH